MQRTILAILAMGLLFSFIGCGDGNPGTVPVSLTFTKKGEPLVGAAVALIPVDSTTGKGAGGLTNSSGVAVLETPPKWKGAMPGEYVVTVKLFEKFEYHFPMPGYPDNTAFDHRNALPEKYASHTTSDFKLTVGKKATQAAFEVVE